MTDSAFLGLVHNAALLLTAAFGYDVMTRRYRFGPSPLVRVAIGGLLGGLGCLLILSPWTYSPGVVFDTRSVLLSVSGIFFGAIPTGMAMAVTAAFRLHLGGDAAWTGVTVILASGSLGIAWRHVRQLPLREIAWWQLYLFGLLVHAVMLALMFTLPRETALRVLAQISLPVLAIYPAATVLMGLLMANRLRRDHDVTELLASQDQMRLFFERQNAGMAITSPTKGWVRVNDGLCRMLGYAREQLADVTWEELTHPDDLQADLEQFERLLAGDIDEYALEKRFIRPDGATVWTELSVGCVRRADGKVDYILALLVDITVRKQAEVALVENERRYRQLFRANPMPMWVYALKTLRFLAVNDAAVARYGYTRDEFLAMTVKDIRPEEDVPALLESIAQTTDGLGSAGLWHHRKKDGSIMEVEVSTHTLHFADRPAKMVLARDVTDRRAVERALQESEERYRTLVNNLPGLAYRCLNDEHWSMIFFSEGAERVTGYPAEEFINNAVRSYASVIHPEDRALVDRAVQVGVTAHRPYEMEYRLIRADGKVVWVYEKGQGIFDAAGDILWLDGVVIDITDQRQGHEERERLQAQLLQAQKMESIGRLAGGVAHDFNNMLQTILGYSDMALDQMDPESPLHEHFVEIRKAAERSANLTRQLLAFARKQTVSPKPIDLNDTLASMLKMLQRLIGENIELAWRPGPDLWAIRIDPSQVDQVLANLMVNARDAIGDTGTVAIRTENIHCGEAFCATRPGMVPGEYVLLEVRDDGCGMDETTLSHIFEPFFTTKGQDAGTGLGLATIYGIVKQNDGFIDVDSAPGEGTACRVYLPRFVTGDAIVPAAAPPAELTGGTETVLLVEDEESILPIAMRMLQRLGYTVLSAETPGLALHLAASYAGKIHLLITDVVMPEMNGRELARQLSTLRPGIKCLYMSGYTANAIAKHGVLEENLHFVPKPFTIRDLATKVREALEA